MCQEELLAKAHVVSAAWGCLIRAGRSSAGAHGCLHTSGCSHLEAASRWSICVAQGTLQRQSPPHASSGPAAWLGVTRDQTQQQMGAPRHSCCTPWRLIPVPHSQEVHGVSVCYQIGAAALDKSCIWMRTDAQVCSPWECMLLLCWGLPEPKI